MTGGAHDIKVPFDLLLLSDWPIESYLIIAQSVCSVVYHSSTTKDPLFASLGDCQEGSDCCKS